MTDLIMQRGIVVPDEGAAWLRDRKLLPMAGGAALNPDEGRDLVINTLLRNTQAALATFYIGLFTSQTATTVPSRDAILATGAGTSPVVEATSTGGYARVAIAAANWPATAAGTTGRRTTVVSPGISFAESTGAFSAAINGFFVATAATNGIALFYANFDQLVAITVNAAGYTVRIPPYYEVT